MIFTIKADVYKLEAIFPQFQDNLKFDKYYFALKLKYKLVYLI